MTVEAVEVAELVGQRKEFIREVKDKVIRKKRCKRRLIRKSIEEVRPYPILALQRLFLACQQAFKGHGTVPSSHDVHKLCKILDAMRPEDVGLSRDLQFFKPKQVADGNTKVANATIYRCENFSLCIFFLPATAVIPLHNHPGMTVFSKLLLGTMHIKSYDWVDPVYSNDLTSSTRKLRLARMKANDIFTAPCDTSVLYPTSGGNIHEFRAITPCAVLDVLGPPYSKDDGRDCSYYKDIPYSALLNEQVVGVKEDLNASYGWLEEIEMPEESEMDVIQYLGPQVSEAA